MTTILAPLRGVTIRPFRIAFDEEISKAGFAEAVTPFITAVPGYDPRKDRELFGNPGEEAVPVVPQFIGKDPAALRDSLLKVRDLGFSRADLNCGCPFPMVRRKFRGSGMLKTPDVLAKMLETGCETMGEGNFSVKTRLGVERADELLELMPLFNSFPLRHLAVHARTAKEMYSGECHAEEFSRVAAAAKMPVVYNGDVPFPAEPRSAPAGAAGLMTGRGFVRSLGSLDCAGELLGNYIEMSMAELCGERPVLGRIKELVAYWKDLPRWKRRWPLVKMSRTIAELRAALR